MVARQEIAPLLHCGGFVHQREQIRRESAQLDDEMLDDMRGLDEIIRFGQGHARLAGIATVRCAITSVTAIAGLNVSNATV